jgi:tryptophan 2,3-dioxygenase
MSDHDQSGAPRPAKRAAEATIRTAFHADGEATPQTYSDFLQLDTLLDLQRAFQDPPQRDELLFVIIHQVSELWLKLMYHELGQVRDHIAGDDLADVLKCIGRIKAIQEQLISAWKVLTTMTPADYLEFRSALGSSSGFQSWGYRLVEYILGNRDEAYLAPHRHDPKVTAMLEAELARPAITDEVIRMLARRGFDVPDELLARDVREPYTGHPAIRAIWLQVYRDRRRHWDLYNLAEKFMDVENLFQRWRFDHMSAVERVIGMEKGTGGSSGVAFLKKALELKFFHDLYDMRSELMYGSAPR